MGAGVAIGEHAAEVGAARIEYDAHAQRLERIIERSLVGQLEARQHDCAFSWAKVAQPGLPALVGQLAPERAQARALLGQKDVHAGAAGAIWQADRLEPGDRIVIELAGLRHHRELLLPPAGERERHLAGSARVEGLGPSSSKNGASEAITQTPRPSLLRSRISCCS